MFCVKCGTNTQDEEKFCRSCGAALEQKPIFSNASVFKPLTETQDATRPSSTDSVYQSEAVVERTSETVLPKRKSHRTVFVVLASILLALAITCIAGFFLRNQIMKTVMPEQYLQASITRTVAQSQMGAGKLLDVGRFTTGAVKNEFSYEQDDEYSAFSIDGSIMYDIASEKSLTNVSFGFNGTDYEDNILVFSRDQIAISIPSQITDTEFLTIDPATFNEEWKKKGYDEIAELPELEELIDSFFGKSEEGDKESTTDAKADFIKSLIDKAVFSTGGTVTKDIGGVDRKLDVMTYTISESDANEGYQEYISELEEQMSDAAESYTGDLDNQFNMFESLEFTSDMEMTFYINQDGYVNQVEISKIEVESNGESGAIEIVLDIWNEDGTTYTSSEITFNAEDDDATVVIESESSFIDGVYTFKADLGAKADGAASSSNISMYLEWDTKDTKGENISLEIEDDSEYGFKMSITGNLIEDKEKISLSDATIDITGESGSLYSAEFSYAISKISASEITVDTSDSTPLLSYKPFKEYMEEIHSYQE